MPKRYCGDGVFIDHNGTNIVLTTEDGVCETNRIVLEPETLASVLDYIQRASRENRHGVRDVLRAIMGGK